MNILETITFCARYLRGKFAEEGHVHDASDVTSGTLDVARIPDLAADKITSGILSVARGGTGKATHTSNALLTGDDTNAVKNVATADGALYATAANGAPQFGTLPLGQGGTGATTAALARTNLAVPSTTDLANLESSIADVEQTTATANHAAGDYFMLGNVLMKATVAIATGEQITTSNATPATIQSQIDTLRDSVGRWGRTGISNVRFDYNSGNNAIEVMCFLTDGTRRYFSCGPTNFTYGKEQNGTWSVIKQV